MTFISEEAAKLPMAGGLDAGTDPSVLSLILCSSLNTSCWLPLETRCWAAQVFHLVHKACFHDLMNPALPGWGSPVCGTRSTWLISNTVVEASGEMLPVPWLRDCRVHAFKSMNRGNHPVRRVTVFNLAWPLRFHLTGHSCISWMRS